MKNSRGIFNAEFPTLQTLIKKHENYFKKSNKDENKNINNLKLNENEKIKENKSTDEKELNNETVEESCFNEILNMKSLFYDSQRQKIPEKKISKLLFNPNFLKPKTSELLSQAPIIIKPNESSKKVEIIENKKLDYFGDEVVNNNIFIHNKLNNKKENSYQKKEIEKNKNLSNDNSIVNKIDKLSLDENEKHNNNLKKLNEIPLEKKTTTNINEHKFIDIQIQKSPKISPNKFSKKKTEKKIMKNEISIIPHSENSEKIIEIEKKTKKTNNSTKRTYKKKKITKIKKNLSPSETNNIISEEKKGPDNESLPKKPLSKKTKQISMAQQRKNNENYVRLNLKKKYQDRFLGEKFKLKRNFTKNGRPKFINKKDLVKYKSNKIETILGNTEKIDAYLANISNSLKIELNQFVLEDESKKLSEVLQLKISEIKLKLPNLDDSDYLYLLKEVFGFENFRYGQLEAIKNIIFGKSTLAILQTGLGKSLIYSFASLLLEGLTIVISPLISLMLDQVEKLPNLLPGVCFNSLLDSEQKLNILKIIETSKVKILFLSPESLESGNMIDFKRFPKVNFVCIDEIHCVSEWSHNFRTSYIKLYYLIKQKLGTNLVLGLTATATHLTIASIMKGFEINELIRSYTFNRPNLHLNISRDSDKYSGLLSLLQSERYQSLKSIIIYCTLIKTTENLSNYLTQSGYKAVPYNSECLENVRLNIQKEFMSGRIRIVVATLAFGMGIDKADVDAIIHFNMPKSLENYIQEIGRAGRNGKNSFCHLFLSDEDYFKLRGYVISEFLDKITLTRILNRIIEISNEKVKKNNDNDNDNENENLVGSKRKNMDEENNEEIIDIKKHGEICYILENDLTKEMEINSSVIMTLLLKLEEFSSDYFEVYPVTKIMCSIRFYKTNCESLCENYKVLKDIIQMCRRNNGSYSFNLVKISNLLKKNPKELIKYIFDIPRNEGISLEFNTPAFCFKIKKEIEETTKEEILNYIMNKTQLIESQMLFKLDVVYMAFKLNSYHSVSVMIKNDKLIKYENQNDNCENKIQKIIQTYFEYEGNNLEDLFEDNIEILPLYTLENENDKIKIENEIINFLKSQFLKSQNNSEFTDKLKNPKSILQILQGVNSKSINWKDFSNFSLWGKYHQYKYEELIILIEKVLNDFFMIYSDDCFKLKKDF